MHRRRYGATLLAAVVIVGMLPAVAFGATTEAIAETGGTSLTLGLPGSPIGFDVTLDEFGNIVELAIDEGADGTVDQTVAGDGEHRIRFASEDGSLVVDVKA